MIDNLSSDVAGHRHQHRETGCSSVPFLSGLKGCLRARAVGMFEWRHLYVLATYNAMSVSVPDLRNSTMSPNTGCVTLVHDGGICTHHSPLLSPLPEARPLGFPSLLALPAAAEAKLDVKGEGMVQGKSRSSEPRDITLTQWWGAGVEWKWGSNLANRGSVCRFLRLCRPHSGCYGSAVWGS